MNPSYGEDSKKEEPPVLMTARREHLRAVQKLSVAPLKDYVRKLELMKADFGKRGMLEEALMVEKELKVANQSLAAAQAAADGAVQAAFPLTIVSARWGILGTDRKSDVTATVKALLESGAASFQATPEDLKSDPASRQSKTLEIEYIRQGKVAKKSFGENSTVRFGHDFK